MASSNELCNAVSVILDDSNYPTWSYVMHHHLRGRGLLKFVDGSYPCPLQFDIHGDGSSSASSVYERWLEQDSYVIFMITFTLSHEAFILVIGCETSMEVWTILKQHYAPKSEFHIMRLKSRLQNIRKGSDSIYKYLLRFKDVQNQLAVVGISVSDEEMRTLILAGLPSEYAHTRQIIRSKDSITMEEVRCLLLSAELELEIVHKAYHLSPFTAIGAHNAITSGNVSLSYRQGSQFGVSAYTMPFVTSGASHYSAYNMPSTSTSQEGHPPPPTTMTSSSDLVHPLMSVGCPQYSTQGSFTYPSGCLAQSGSLYSNITNNLPSPQPFGAFSQGDKTSQFQSYGALAQNTSLPERMSNYNTQYNSRGYSYNYGAYRCYQRKPQQQGQPCRSTVKCQIWKKPDHATKTCGNTVNNRNGNNTQVACTNNALHEAWPVNSKATTQMISDARSLQNWSGVDKKVESEMTSSTVSKSSANGNLSNIQGGASPKALSASICNQPKPSSTTTKPDNSISQPQVEQSILSHPHLKQTLKEIDALPFPGTCLATSTPNIDIMNSVTLRNTTEYALEDLSSMMSTNVESPYHLCQLSYPLLKASENGSIVFIASIAGIKALPRLSAYAATKSAVIQISKNLACEWAKDGIRTNTV